jgi:hypothetical protein
MAKRSTRAVKKSAPKKRSAVKRSAPKKRSAVRKAKRTASKRR